MQFDLDYIYPIILLDDHLIISIDSQVFFECHDPISFILPPILLIIENKCLIGKKSLHYEIMLKVLYSSKPLKQMTARSDSNASLRWFLLWVWTLATSQPFHTTCMALPLPLQSLSSEWHGAVKVPFCMGPDGPGLGNERAHDQNLVLHLSQWDSIPLTITTPTSRCERNVSALWMTLTWLRSANTNMAHV